MAFDVEAARKAGYSDAEIADYLASGNKFDAKKARDAGYTDSELIAHLSSKTDMVSQIPGHTGPTDYGYGKRADGSMKGRGFLGELRTTDGSAATEITVGVNIDGREMEIPTLVPTLSKPEIDSLLRGDQPSDAIVSKAVQHAKARLASGKSVFADEPATVRPPAPTRTKEPTFGEKIIGAGEAALSTVTGATGGAAGMVGGAIGGLAGSIASGEFGTQEGVRRVEQAAAEGAQALTYEPRTASGREQAQAVGQAMQQMVPVAPLVPQMAAAGQGMQAAAPAVAVAGRSAVQSTRDIVKAKVLEAAARRAQAANEPQMQPTPGTMGSVGAAGTDIATVRRALADDLMPENARLTKGQATRDFEQERFEGEIAKDPVKGAAIRERLANQRQAIWGRFEQWVDETGEALPELGQKGDAVVGALRQRAAREKTEIRVAFKKADNSPEAQLPVNLAKEVAIGEGDSALTSSPIAYLNSKPTGLKTTGLTDHARQAAVKMGIAQEVDGQLTPLPATVKQVHDWRKEINAATGFDPVEVRDATILKRLIDVQTNEVAGPLYQRANMLRRQYADRYENFGLARDLMGTKRGTNDAKIAAEQVFQKAILTAPMADVKQLGQLLKAGGDSGRQAWAELQGAAVRHIRDQAMRNVARDERGTPIPSVKALQDEIGRLDRTGKLDYLFGKKGGEQLRAIEELSKIALTVPPGAVNTSNTASVILAALDMATSGVAGFPLPVMSGLRILTTHVKDRQIQKRIREALGIKPEPKKVKAPQSVVPPQSMSLRLPENRTLQ